MGLIGIIFILIHKQKPEKILIFFSGFLDFYRYAQAPAASPEDAGI